MRTMKTRGIVFAVSVFATLVAYGAVLCGKIVEMLLYHMSYVIAARCSELHFQVTEHCVTIFRSA